MNTQPREVLSNIVQQLTATYGDLLSVQAAIERSAIGNAFHEDEIENLQKLDHATQFVDAITTILQNILTVPLWDEKAEISLDAVLQGVRLGNVRSVFLGRETQSHEAAGEMDFF
ncbi:hypothetical protein [Asaia astilbis]|uniref:hypothetical protein n=1 Tax=Asaia astilbis TaxID=610244 RepID=UPI0004702D02|nr:hypothetical protein [Asaia astilbis]